MAKTDSTGTPQSSVPENNYTKSDLIALGLNSQRKYRTDIVNPGISSSLNMDLMRQELGDEFQLHKGESYLVDTFNKKVAQNAYITAKTKAEEQGFWGELAGFAGQAIAGEVVLGTLEGIGYLLDFDHWISKLSGGEGDWGNWMSNMAASGQENIKDYTPIYQDPDNQGRNMWQNMAHGDGWWATNGVSIASALSLMIPAAGWTRGVSMVGKGINMLGKLGQTGKFGKTGMRAINLVDDIVKNIPAATKMEKNIVDGVHKAIVSRHLENHMEAAGVYQEQYDKYIAQGMSPEEAKKAAGEGAAFTYKAGWAMLLTDIPQYIMLGRGFNPSKAILNQSVAKAASQSIKKTAMLNLGVYAKQFASEGFEEAYQFVVSEEGKHHADVIAGIADPNKTSFSDRLDGYVKDSELWTAAFFGGFGGVTFQAAGAPVNEFINKKLLKKGEAIITEKEARIQEIMNRKQIISANVKSYYEALDAGDERAVEAAKSRIGFDLGINAAKVGNWALAKGSMEQLKNATEAEKKEYGIDDEFIDNIDKHIKSAEKAVELYSANMGKYEASTVEAITYRQYNIHQFAEKLPEVRSNIEKLKQQVPLINDLSEGGKSAFEAKLEVKAQQRYIRAAKYRLDKMNMPENEKAALSKSIETAEQAITQYEEILKENIKQGLSVTEQVTLNSLDGSVTEELSKAKAEAKWLEHYLGQYSEEVNNYTSEKFQKETAAREEAAAEKAKKQIKASKKSEQIQKDKDKLNGIVSEEEQNLSEEYAGTETNTTLEDLNNKIINGEIPLESLPAEVQKAILDYRGTKATTNENPDASEEVMEQFGLDLASLTKRDAAADFQKQSNNAVDHIEHETPENPSQVLDWRVGDDISQGSVTTLHTPLAWLSPNNSWAKPEHKTTANKALASFLESNNSLEGVEVVFEINEAWLNTPGVKLYPKIKQELAAKRVPEDLGFVPIVATLYRNGKPLEFAGEVLKMNLHDKDFYFKYDNSGKPTVAKSDHSEAQLATLETHKRAIIEASFTGNKLKAPITGKTGGNINLGESKGGEFAKISLLEALGPIKDIELVYGNSHSGFINAKGNVVENLWTNQNATNGAIYALTETANGTAFPLRLQVENINRTEASIIYKIYTDLLNNEKLYSQPLSDEIVKVIETSKDPRISGLNSYLDLSKTTYAKLLSHLIYEGKKTEGKEEGRLFTYPKNEKTGQPAILAFGKTKTDLTNLQTSQGRQAFIEHLVKHRRRQIDVKMLDDVKYKEYLSNNNVLTTNATPTSTKSLFVQPTVSYSMELEPVNADKTFRDVAIESLKTDLEYEKNSEFGNPTIISALEGQLSKLENINTPIEQSQAPKGTKDGGVDIEMDFNEDNAFDLSTILPNPEIKVVSNLSLDTNQEALEKNEFVIKIKKIASVYAGGQQYIGIKGQSGSAALEQINYEMFGEKVKPEHLLYFKDTFGGELYNWINRAYKELTGKTFEEYDTVITSNREQIAEYNADEAEDAKEKARKAKLERAKKKKDQGETGAFKRFKGLPNTESFQDIQDEAAHIQNLLPSEIGVRLTPGYLQVLSQGHIAIGMFKNGMITLSDKAPKGLAYHEAFHAVYRTMLTVPQQLDIIKESQKIFENPTKEQLSALMEDHKVNLNEATLLFYEEILADEFADYMLNEPLAKIKYSYPKGIKGLFQKLSDWINSVFRNKLNTRKLFNNINTGKYRTKTPLITRSVAFKAHPVFSANEVQEITQQLTFAAFSKIKSLEDVDKNFDSSLIEDTLDAAYLEASEMNSPIGEEIMNRIELLYNDKQELDTFWVKKIKEYVKINFDLKEVNKIDDHSDLDEENMDSMESNDFYKSSYEVSGKDNATSTVKFIIAMTPNIESYKDGQPIYKKSSLLGLPTFNDFGSTYNTIEKILAGTTSIVDAGIQQDPLKLMISKLEMEFRYKPELKFIVDKLSTMDESVQTQLHYVFSRQKGNYIDHLLEGTPGNINSKIGSSDIDSKESVIRYSWATTFAKNFGQYNEQGQYLYSIEAILDFKATRDNFKRLLNRDLAAKELNTDTIQELKRTLTSLGVVLSPKALDKIMDSYMPPSNLSMNMQMLFSVKHFTDDLINATNGIFKREGILEDRTNHMLDEDSFFKNILARNEADFKKVGGESTFLGPDGNQYYTFQDNNLISKSIAQFKAGDLTYLEKLKASDYSTRSLWLHQLLHPTTGEAARELFTTALYGNFKELNSADRGDKASDLKPADQCMDVFNKYLHGVYVGLAEADKSQQTYFIGPKVENAGVSFAPAQGKAFFTNEKPRAARILIGYLADELMRMETARKAYFGFIDPISGEKHPPLAEDKQLLYYHYNFDKEGNRIPGNAFQSFLFPSINLEALGLKDPDTGEIYPLTAESFDNNKELWDYVKNKFLDAVNNDLLVAEEFGLISKKGSSYTNIGIANKHLKDRQGDIVAAIADFTLNSIIANVEQTKLFNGDPALYKVKYKFEGNGALKPWNTVDIFTDLKKRIPAAIASGKDFRIFNEPNGVIAVRPKYNSATIANIDSISSSFFGTEEGTFNEDNLDLIEKTTGVKKSELKQLFKPYLKVNQTDAQAWITLDTYKERLRGLGKWTNAHEQAYIKAKNNQPVDFSDIKLLAQPLKTVHVELLSTDTNVMSMQYNKQSEAVLLPFITKGHALDNLRVAMENQGVDHVIVLDGKKVGTSGITSIADAQGNIFKSSDIKLNPVALSYNNLFLQQDLPSKGIKPTLVGSQATKNVMSVVNLDATYMDNKTGRELIDAYHKAKSNLSDIGLKKFKEEVGFNEDTQSLDRDENNTLKYNKRLQTEFIGEISDNHMEALDTDVDYDALPIKDKIQNKGNAMITKMTVKLKQLGAALIQMSDFGFVGSEVDLSKEVKDGIIWFKDPREKLKPMHITEEGVQPAQVLIPWTQGKKIQKILKKHNIKLQDLTHEQIKAMIDPQVLRGLSYRIPNQGPSSNDAFEIVGILPPQAGDTMVAYSAITTKIGSDFDIDKAFIILPNFFFNEKSGKIEKIQDPNTKEGIENQVLDIMQSMLLHPNAYASVMAPLDAPWLENLAKELYPEGSATKDLDFFTGTHQMKTKSIFDGAKNLVGVIANHMSHHALALSEDLYFKNYYLGKGIKVGTSNIQKIEKRNIFTVNPIQSADKKAKIKASLATKYIGFGDNIEGSSTAHYAKEAGTLANYGTYHLEDVVFLSVGGKRGSEQHRKENLEKTKVEVDKALKAGAVIIKDNEQYVNNSNYNIGEKELSKYLRSKGATYSEQLIDGELIGIWQSVRGQNSSISNKYDEDGNPIEVTLGAFMNAIVDAAKDPFIVRANINQMTAGTAFMLARAGVSREWIVSFMGQPILKEYVRQTALQEGRFVEDKFDIETGKRLKPLDLTLAHYNSRMSTFDLYQSEFSLQGGENREIEVDVKTLMSQLTEVNNAVKEGRNPEIDLLLQEKVLAQFLQWQKKAKSLNDVIKICKADVNGATKNLTRAKLTENLLHKIIVEDQIGNVDKLLGYSVEDGNVYFGEKDIRMTGTYFQNSIRAARTIFKGLFISNTEAAERSLESIAAHAGYVYMDPSEENETLADKINNEIYALTASETDAFKMSSEELQSLLFGTPGKIQFGEVIPRQFSIANRVNQAKSGPHKNNLLIVSLETKPSYGANPAKVYLPQNETTKMVKDSLYLAWLELFEQDKALAEDLIKYAFYASGFSRSLGSFYDHIPMEKLAEYNYSSQIRAKKTIYNNNELALQEKEDLIYKHLYKDHKLVPKVSSKHVFPVKTVDGLYSFKDTDVFILVEGEGEGYIAGKDIEGKVVFKRFLKRERPLYNNQREVIGIEYDLYQLQGYTPADGAVYVKVNKLGYNSKGNIIKEYIGNGNSSIFAENNVSLPSELFAYINNLGPNSLPVSPYDKTEKKTKKKPEEGREDRLNLCINKQ